MKLSFPTPVVVMLAVLVAWPLAAPVSAQVLDTETELDQLLDESTGPDAAVKQFEKTNPDIRKAAEQFSQRDFNGASETLKRARDTNPTLPPVGVILGTWHARINNLPAARAAFEVAARDNPTDPEAFVVFGESALRQRRVTDAALLFERANNLLATFDANASRKKLLSLRALSGIAAVAEMRGEWKNARNALDRLLAIDEQNINGQIRSARALFNQGEADDNKDLVNQAYKAFQQVHKQDPERVARPEINMARLYQQVDKEDNAKKLVMLAIDRDKDGLATQLAAAQWAIDTGNLDLVKSCADTARSIDAEAIQVLLLDGFIARLNKNYDEAVAAFQKALQKSPSSPVVLNQLAICLAEQDEPEKRQQASQYVQLLLNVSGDRTRAAGREALLTAAWVLFRTDRGADALRQVQLALTSGGVSPDSAYFAAKILSENDQKDAAKALLKSSLEASERLFPNRSNAEALLSELQ